MKPDLIIDGIQLDTYLKQYNVQTYLSLIRYKQDYSLDNFIENVNTNIFYKDTEIVIADVIFKDGVKKQEKDLIIEALNNLRLKII